MLEVVGTNLTTSSTRSVVEFVKTQTEPLGGSFATTSFATTEPAT